MAATPESLVKKKVRELLNARGVTYIKTPMSVGYSSVGDFDIRCLYKGASIGIETKATDRDMPTVLQTDNALAHFTAGGISLCIHDTNVFMIGHVLNMIDEHPRAAHQRLLWPDAALNKYYQQQKGNDDVVVICEGSK